MAVYDDVERRTCGHCGLKREARSMICLSGQWICFACCDAGRRVADNADLRKRLDLADKVISDLIEQLTWYDSDTAIRIAMSYSAAVIA